MTAQVFNLPDLGEGLREAELVRWHVQVGETVAVDTPIVEVETAKATVEIPSPYEGTVARLHADEGTVVGVGQPLISVDTEGPRNVLVGYGPPPRAERRTRVRVVSPVVRKLAKEHGIDLGTITGTGPNGVITRTDVESAQPDMAAVRPTESDSLPVAERIPLRGTRGAIAETLSRSRREIPEATIWVDVDVTPLLDLHAMLKPGSPGLLAFIARFAIAALARFPALNARVDLDAQEITQFAGVHLGIATQTDRGLLVPAVADAHTRSARTLGQEIRRLTEAARDGTATPAELTRGSFTLNNYGRFGVDGSAAIINHPQVAILGIGRILPRPWVVDGTVVARHVTQLSLVFDHRVCDGETAGGFLRFVADAIECPVALLAEL
ncbi:dihydrolipoamide acetyltransferase family protein [Amycolatopsis sp. NPDC059090]|uniref:dihydrolipoamide acetyltransferase family protein n=1 Tax=Amycolatopsis sp. NPDC059090 TaxID=3346723 RepID=UPI003671F5FD